MVEYSGWNWVEWHARFVCADVGDRPGHMYMVLLTPDGDLYTHDLGEQSAELSSWMVRPENRQVPRGVPRNAVYDFANAPGRAALVAMSAEAERIAERDRGRLGVVVPIRPELPVVAGGGAAAAAPPALGGGGLDRLAHSVGAGPAGAAVDLVPRRPADEGGVATPRALSPEGGPGPPEGRSGLRRGSHR